MHDTVSYLINNIGESNKSTLTALWRRANAITGGVLLISGTCIGAGMLGLPVTTAAAGFYPTLFCFIAIWLVMTFAALAFLEVSFFLPGETNFISLVQVTLGNKAKKIAWLAYLLFLYSIMAAYTSGGITALAQVLAIDIHVPIKLAGTIALFVLPFAVMIYCGTNVVDRINRWLVLALFVAFAAICWLVAGNQVLAISSVESQPKFLLFGLPLMVTSFGYHLLIPTLKSHMRENVNNLRLAIVIGGLLPFIIYLAWEYVVLSLVPTWGAGGLVDMLHGESNPADMLVSFLTQENCNLSWWVVGFSFLALISSFIGVGLSLYDFFADGLQIQKNSDGKLALLGLTFIPPIVYTVFFPNGFLLALGYAGVFASILLIIYPVLMAWSKRYWLNAKDGKVYAVAGGKLALVLAFLCGLAVIAAEILAQLKMLPIPMLIGAST